MRYELRNILLHCHFFKNAGSSLDWALRRSFKSSFEENKNHFYSVHEWNSYLEDFIKKHRHTDCISSHIFSLHPPTNIPDTQIHTIALVRHPIERVTSVAAYEKKQGYKNSLGTITDPDIGIVDYVMAYMKEGTPASIRNIHTLRFAGRDNGSPVTRVDLDKAMLTIQRCKTIGLVECFDESMVLFEEVLKPVFPSLDLAYIKQNVMQPSESIKERVSSLKAQLGREVFSILENKNAEDMTLYHFCKETFFQRLSDIKNFQRKLDDFRERCCRLRT